MIGCFINSYSLGNKINILIEEFYILLYNKEIFIRFATNT